MNQPVIILVQPQMGENIGMCARAMLNFGLSELRLVAPRDGWPNGRALASASGADVVINRAQVFKTLEEAVADLNIVYGTSPRHHDMVKTTYPCQQAATRVRGEVGESQKVGILFGCERVGLTNEDISRCDALIIIPTNPEFYSLNLAQAVIVWAYAYFMTADASRPVTNLGKSRPANKEELNNFIHRLELNLEAGGFFTSEEMRPGMQHNLRSVFTRAQMTEQEVRTMHGVVKALVKAGTSS